MFSRGDGRRLRGLRRWPGVAVLTIALLALGTGLTTALVSLVSGVLLTPPPYADPSRLVLVAPSRIDGPRAMKIARIDGSAGSKPSVRPSPFNESMKKP